MPELRHLRYFVAVAEELNFSHAARKLRMAQPPLSMAIRQLEDELGVNLFERTTREVRLTDAGLAFLVGARRALAEADAAVFAAKRTAAGELGDLNVGYSWVMRLRTLPALAQAFDRRFPGVELSGFEMGNAAMGQALRHGKIDVALTFFPEVSADFHYESLGRQPVVAVMSAEHPLAKAASIDLGDLADERFFLFPRDEAPRVHDFFTGLFRAAGFEPRAETVSFQARWTLRTWQPTAIALLPADVSCDLVPGLAAVPVRSPADQLEIYAVWRPDDRRAVVMGFLDVAREGWVVDSVVVAVR